MLFDIVRSQASTLISQAIQHPAKMSSLSIMSSDAEVDAAIKEVFATIPLHHNMRWELEVQRRRITQYEKDMRVAKKAYDALNKSVTLTGSAEIAEHNNAFREAQSKYELERSSWISAVGHVGDFLTFAMVMDQMAINAEAESEDRCEYEDDEVATFCYLPEAPEGSIEETRNKALQEAERIYCEARRDIHDECVSFYRGSNAHRRSSAIRVGTGRLLAEYKNVIAELEEAYYQARLGSL